LAEVVRTVGPNIALTGAVIIASVTASLLRCEIAPRVGDRR